MMCGIAGIFSLNGKPHSMARSIHQMSRHMWKYRFHDSGGSMPWGVQLGLIRDKSVEREMTTEKTDYYINVLFHQAARVYNIDDLILTEELYHYTS